ncbi:MAG TPA: RlmE family RNA methyltransferase [Rhizomicrobium sp.]|jgi:23S rRNA (uridine2552-2'-O)-methyltransferase|nr:RlmE family RNA methyltransferase [Rhizomicrobium sp.]
MAKSSEGDKSGRGRVPVKVKKDRGRTQSSRSWLQRQLNDPYVAKARSAGYRSRAAFKLVEMDEKFHFLKKGARILDLGSAPGGWSQVAAARGATVVAADVLVMDEIPGVTFFQADLTDADVPAMLRQALDGPADVVMTDMAAPTTGHRATDHIRTIALVEIALEVAEDTLKPGGAFVGKVFQGGSSNALLARLKKDFREVKHVKPPASRAESVELYVVALGFKATR